MKRRTFLRTTTGALAASAVLPVHSLCSLIAEASQDVRPGGPRILLRSSWQVVNIGDIAHTPGVLTLLERHIPEAEVTLWASGDLSAEVAAMEHRRFPRLEIVKGTIGADGRASNQDLADAVARADFLLHGSGPSLVAAKDVAAFVKHTGKPFRRLRHHARLVPVGQRPGTSQPGEIRFLPRLGLAGPGQGRGRHVPRDGVWPGRGVCL